MAEDITDLTEDKDSVRPGRPVKEKKEKTAKPAKQAKQPKEKKPKPEKGDKKSKQGYGKKSKKGLVILIVLLVIVLIVAGVAAMLYFNILDARDILGEYLHEPIMAVAVWFNPELTHFERELRVSYEVREVALTVRELGQNTRESELVLREEEASARELALDRREAALETREQQLNMAVDASVPLFRRNLSDQEIADMESLSRSYAQMAPADAARILAELPEAQDAAAILFFMADRSVGPILSAMDAEFAADVTQILLGG